MTHDTFSFRSDADLIDVFVYSWLPKGNARAIVQIAHGMAEHAARYGRLAEALVAEGFAVYANDHRGHGQTAENGGLLGHYADHDGWNRAVADVRQLTIDRSGAAP